MSVLNLIRAACPSEKISPEAIPTDLYSDPRPVLKAGEIAWMKQVAEIVGMTIASELTVSSEMAFLCCHMHRRQLCQRVCDARVSYEFIISMVRENQRKAVDLLDSIIKSAS